MKRYLALVSLLAVVAVGCSGQPSLEGVVPAAGTVTQGGSPLEGAIVTFSPAAGGGKAASATTDADGKFALTTLTAGDGAMPGDYKVLVKKTETVGKQYTSEEANEYYNQHGTQPPEAEIKHLVDKKYSSTSTTPLTITIPEAGDKNLVIEID